MRFSYSQNALALLLAALSLFASADAKVKKNKTELQAAYPDPRVHPSSCGRKGLSKSHICDPHGVLSRASQDRVDLIARSVSSYGPLAGVVVFEQILLEKPQQKIRFSCKASARKAAREILEGWKAEDLVLVSKNDFQFCMVQRSKALSEGDIAEIEESAAELLAAQDHTTVDLLDQAIQFALLQMQQKSADENPNLKGKLDSALVPKPTGKEMWQMVLAHTIPFIGFGITDNGLMIMFGEAIEQLLGQAIGLSTMGAAATGNLLSDIAGIFLGGQVQALSYRLGASEPDFTKEQRQLPVTRYCKMFGESLGITIGCIIGMFPLLFMDQGDREGSSSRAASPAPEIPSVKSMENFSA
mmetsp:Transcript_14534/g.34447  ORF Transcript_14534/g.34447 Transcript_14534/m.34447 type:complete len:357 (+) Transcript_14534:154-1224(+)